MGCVLLLSCCCGWGPPLAMGVLHQSSESNLMGQRSLAGVDLQVGDSIHCSPPEDRITFEECQQVPTPTPPNISCGNASVSGQEEEAPKSTLWCQSRQLQSSCKTNTNATHAMLRTYSCFSFFVFLLLCFFSLYLFSFSLFLIFFSFVKNFN